MTQDEQQQVLGVSIKVTVVSKLFKEPLTFTCDGEPDSFTFILEFFLTFRFYCTFRSP